MILIAQNLPPEGDAMKDVPVYDSVPDGLPKGALHVVIRREMFSDFFQVYLSDKHTEELHYEEVREWFKLRGADMDALEKALDHAWNFQESEFVILRPLTPIGDRLRHTPKL